MTTEQLQKAKQIESQIATLQQMAIGDVGFHGGMQVIYSTATNGMRLQLLPQYAQIAMLAIYRQAVDQAIVWKQKELDSI